MAGPGRQETSASERRGSVPSRCGIDEAAKDGALG